MGNAIVLKAKDQFELELVYKASSGQMSRKEARALLGISERTMGRWIAGFRQEGISFVRHGNSGRKPVNRSDDKVRELVQGLVKEKYFDFNMLHTLEKIREETGIIVGRERFRRWCHSIGMVKRLKQSRRSKPRFRRERMGQAGLLVMMDGSYHRWFGDVESCLILTLDDATSEVLYAEFFYGGETTVACMRVLRASIQNKGTFRVLYTDRAGVFGGIKRSGFSQVERAMEEIGTQLIYAYSPEAKGRIERLFQTFQDRLIPEMRIKGIRSLAEANRFLQEEFLPHHYRPRFTVLPRDPKNAFTLLHPSVDLDSIFSVKEYRQVAKDHTISLGGERFLIEDRLKYSIHGQKLEIRWKANGKDWQAYFAGRPLNLIRIQRAQKIPA
jgi:transposase